MNSRPTTYSQQRYLFSKRTVDDRALNRPVMDELRRHLEPAPRPRILELGAGVGTMLARLVDRGIVEAADYVLVDHDEPSLEAARRELESWEGASTGSDGELRVRRGQAELTIRFEPADALEFCSAVGNRSCFDAVFANAVLDLMDLEPALERIFECLVPGGLFWFSINFDGETIFVPSDPLDREVVHLYHRSMEPPRRVGSSTTGRQLLEVVSKLGKEMLAAGSSDWVVIPHRGSYPADESYFLHHIVDTIAGALAGHPDLENSGLARWIETRHRQIDEGRLSYIAHQLDVLGCSSGWPREHDLERDPRTSRAS